MKSLIVSPCYSQTEKYCDDLVTLLQATWKNHPEIWFLTDEGALKHSNVLKISSSSWVEILYRGLLELKEKYREVDYVYLILEDLLPIWGCVDTVLMKIEKIARERGMRNVAFVTYDGWGKEPSFEQEGVRFFEVSKDFEFYSQLQPALWEMNHLLEICKESIRKNLLDPWSFEKIGSLESHYVAEYRWPNVWGGLLVGRRVNFSALSKIQMPEGAKLKRKLFKNYLLELPGSVTRRHLPLLARFLNIK